MRWVCGWKLEVLEREIKCWHVSWCVVAVGKSGSSGDELNLHFVDVPLISQDICFVSSGHISKYTQTQAIEEYKIPWLTRWVGWMLMFTDFFLTCDHDSK